MWDKTVNSGYSVLQTAMLNKADRSYAATILEQLDTGVEADIRAGRDFFGFKYLDPVGRVGVLTYKGIEVAVFFRREVNRVAPCSADPVQEEKIVDPKNVWLRISLLDEKGSRQKAKGVLTAVELELRDEKVLTESLTKEVKALVEDLRCEKGKTTSLRQEVRELKKQLGQATVR